MLIPHHLNPPISGKGHPRIYPYLGKRTSKDIPLSREKDIQGYTPISGIGYRWQLQKTLPFPGFLGKSSRDYTAKNTPRKWERACGPLMHSSGGGGGGGGGGGRDYHVTQAHALECGVCHALCDDNDTFIMKN